MQTYEPPWAIVPPVSVAVIFHVIHGLFPILNFATKLLRKSNILFTFYDLKSSIRIVCLKQVYFTFTRFCPPSLDFN